MTEPAEIDTPTLRGPDNPPVTARGRGVIAVLAWQVLLLLSGGLYLLSLLVGPTPFRPLEFTLEALSAGLALFILRSLPERRRVASTAAGVAILVAVALFVSNLRTDPRPPGGDAFFQFLAILKSTLLLIPLGIYLYLDRLRRHGYLT